MVSIRCIRLILVLLFKSDIDQRQTDDSLNYVTYAGQNLVVGDAVWGNDYFDDASTASFVIKADGSAVSVIASGGIQMDANSNVSIGEATPSATEKLWVNGSTKIEISATELLQSSMMLTCVLR